MEIRFACRAEWDGQFWVVTVAGLPDTVVPVTQGSDREDAARMAIDVIALTFEIPLEEVSVEMTYVGPDDVR